MLKGQWTGPYAGSQSGEVILELDEVDGQLSGTATVYPSDLSLPTTFVPLTARLDAQALNERLQVFPIDWQTGNPVPWAQIAKFYPHIQAMSDYADVNFTLSGDTLYLGWVSNIGNHGLAILTRGSPNARSNLQPLQVRNWTEFKQYATSLEPRRYIFRGQTDSSWRLQTYFHRTGRADLRRFMNIDMQTLHRNLSGLTSHVFNLSNPTENAAFYALAQHHGYPTPLLDWTFSPFVAAYFAYRTLRKDQRTDERRVRVFIFDEKTWRNDYSQASNLTPARRHFSLLAPLSINNPRLVPQQAIVTVSNVADIESYIEEKEAERSKGYLQAIDLPAAERSEVMQELSMMGITAGSMFPGLDGACEQLREELFEM